MNASLRLGVSLGLFCILAAGAHAAGTQARTASGRPPNIVLIVADDLGYGQVSAYPQVDPLETPSLDRLASSGIRMTHGYVADPLCQPSRAALLTGKYPQRFPSAANIPRQHRMTSEYLQEAGYVTACIGKWHQGFDEANHPLEWGFGEFFGFLGGLHDYHRSKLTLAELRKGMAATSDPRRWISLQRLSPILDGREEVKDFGYLTDESTDRAVDFIRRSREEPFFLYLPYNAIHRPLHGRRGRPEDAPNDRPVLHQMIAAVDEGVGRVLDTLQSAGLRDDTAVFFVSDNGARLHASSPRGNGGLRGSKGIYTEGGIRIPFLVSWPARLAASKTYEHPVSTMDLLPTIAAIASVGGVSDATLDGVDLLPYWLEEKSGPPHEALYWGQPGSERYAVRQGRFKLIDDPRRRAKGLFDLASDPAEERDVAAQYPARVADLERLVRQWRSAVWHDSGAALTPPPSAQGQRSSPAPGSSPTPTLGP